MRLCTYCIISVFLQVNSDTSVDIYSFGVLLFQLLTHEKVDVDSVDSTETFNAGMVSCCSVLKNFCTVEIALNQHVHKSQLSFNCSASFAWRLSTLPGSPHRKLLGPRFQGITLIWLLNLLILLICTLSATGQTIFGTYPEDFGKTG